MSYLEFIRSEEAWRSFLERQESKEFEDKRLTRQIKGLLRKGDYKKFTEEYLEDFALPKKVELKRYNTSKTRTVYVYPGHHMLLLKLTAYYILENYKDKFIDNSIAYTPGRSAKSAFDLLKGYDLEETDTVYKNDFSDYFNSIPLDRLGVKLKSFLGGQERLCGFIMRLLREERVKVNGQVKHIENKGVMAGSPISGILANIYMHDVDKKMEEKGYKYIRYADDTLTVGEEALEFFKEQIKGLDIKFNPDKTEVMNIKDGITFLGFFFKGDKIDISRKARDKMKSRLKRRAKWYRQWMFRKDVKKKTTLRDYIRKLNWKLFSDKSDSFNWSRWYLPNINTTESLEYLDHYFVDCIRYLDSGTWTKGKKFYRLSYSEIKKLGFKSLVNEYYKLKNA